MDVPGLAPDPRLRRCLARLPQLRQPVGMDAQRFRCLCCGCICLKQTPTQRYCGCQPCQRARKNAWRRSKYACDHDYRSNQLDSTRAWLEFQGGAANYYREYRQRRRAPRTSRPCAPTGMTETESSPPIGDAPSRANSDAGTAGSCVFSGVYRLVPEGGANSDAIFVNLSVISRCSEEPQISTR